LGVRQGFGLVTRLFTSILRSAITPQQGFPLLSFTQNQKNKWEIQVESLFLCGEKMIYAAFGHA
jgi:hypothetical protein